MITTINEFRKFNESENTPPTVEELYKMFTKVNDDCIKNGEEAVALTEVEYYTEQINNIFFDSKDETYSMAEFMAKELADYVLGKGEITETRVNESAANPVDAMVHALYAKKIENSIDETGDLLDDTLVNISIHNLNGKKFNGKTEGLLIQVATDMHAPYDVYTVIYIAAESVHYLKSFKTPEDTIDYILEVDIDEEIKHLGA